MPEDKNEKGAVEEFLGEIGQPKDDPFKSDDPFAAKEEKVEDDDKVEEKEEKLPFHKDPKVMRFVEKEIKKAIKDLPQPVIREVVKTDDINLPSSFIELVGNDTPEKQRVLKDLSSYFQGLKGEARKEFLQEVEERQQREVAEDKRAQEQLDQGFEDIEEAYGVDLSSSSPQARKTRSEFVDYIRKIAPKNEEGDVVAFPDLPAAYEEFQERNKRPPSRAKELAARGMSRSTDASTAPKVADKSWKGVEKLFNNLSS